MINDSEYAIFSISKPAIINPESNNPNGSKARPNTAVCLSPLVQYIVSGDRQSGLNVAVERTSRLTNISRLSRKTAEQTANVLVRRLTKHPVDLVKSITYDNGAENVLHEKINNALQCTSYFCEPYHSWEKGSVEQINGLIRRTFPKGTNFGEITNSEINRLEKLLNNRPRKCLNYQTPYEVFQQLRGALTG